MKKLSKLTISLLTLSFLSSGSNAFAKLKENAEPQLPQIDFEMLEKLDHFTKNKINGLLDTYKLSNSKQEKEEIVEKIKSFNEIITQDTTRPTVMCRY